MNAPLWPHQERAVDRIARSEAFYAGFDPRTGKSRVIVEYVRRHAPRRTLILCPRSVIPVWPAQFERFAPDANVIVCAPTRGTVARRLEDVRAAWTAAGAASLVVVLNREAAWREPMGTALLRPEWDLVVVDEIHQWKAPGGVASRWLARMLAKAKKRVGLSGTPLPHSIRDAYAQCRFLDPTIFGTSVARFDAEFVEYGGHRVGGRPVQVVGYRNLEEFERRFGTICERVRREDVMEIPAQMDVTIPVELPPAARDVYDQIEDEMIADLSAGTVTAKNALVKLLRLAQITAGEVPTEDGRSVPLHSEKADALAEFLDEIDADEPVVVFYRFTTSRDAILRVAKAAGRTTAEISGERNTIGAQWLPVGGAVAAVQLKAGGVGIDLAAARFVVFHDLDFSLGDHIQARDRVQGVGQKKKVVYHYVIARDTVDEKIAGALRAREKVIEAVLASMSGQAIA